MTRMVDAGKVLFVCIALLGAPFAMAASDVIATVNGEAIRAGDLKSWAGRKGARDGDLDRLVLFRLAVQEAKRKGLDAAPRTRDEIERILYRQFLETELKAAGKTLSVSKKSLKNEYKKAPLIRASTIIVRAQTEKQKKIADRTLSAIAKDLKRGSSFETVAMKYSQDVGAKQGGDLDWVGRHSFPEPLYQVLLSLKDGTSSKPVLWDNIYYILYRAHSVPFSKITGTYRQFLETSLRQNLEQRFLTNRLEKLRAKSNITYHLSPMTP